MRPSLATTGGPLFVASSPYAKRGILWNAFRRYHDELGPILVWKAETRRMNPTVPQSVIDDAYEADTSAAAAEYGAQFRDDLEAYISRELIDSVTLSGVREIPPQPHIRYVGFVDAAGGSGGGDSMTCAIAHFDHKDGCTVLDCVREVKPPFSPESVTEEFCRLFSTYNKVTQAHADKWGSGFVVEAFQRHGVHLVPAEQTKSTLYVELLPIISSARCRLLDVPRLANQLTSLERRVGRGTGRDSIDHPPAAHDDLSNAAAGAIVLATQRTPLKIDPSVLQRARAMGRRGERASLQAARGYGSAVYCGGQSFPSRWRGN